MKKLMMAVIGAAALTCAMGAGADETAVVRVDFSKKVRDMKPMHGVGQAPAIGWNYDMFRYLKEAGVPFSRLHDVGGYQGRSVYVDIPNLFRDFDADETNPANYDFTFTDRFITALVQNGMEPFFRLGVTIENLARIKAYRTYPPKDFAKWARICEHVVRHYTEGWANGFKYKIRYWEIWNEPEHHPDPNQNEMWHGTFEEYLRLYEVASKHLKKCFPHIKVGGYASAGLHAGRFSPEFKKHHDNWRYRHFKQCYFDFLKFVKEKECPFDFFSFHTYSPVKEAMLQIEWAIETLHAHGFTNVETTVNEWLPLPRHERLGTADQAADVCAEMIAMQRSKLDSAMIYDAKCGIGRYSPLFNPLTYKPHKAYYALKAFNEAYKLKREVESNSANGDVFVLAAGDAKGGVVLVANISGKEVPFNPDLGGKRVTECLVTDAARTYEKIGLPKSLPPHSFALLRAE